MYVCMHVFWKSKLKFSVTLKFEEYQNSIILFQDPVVSFSEHQFVFLPRSFSAGFVIYTSHLRMLLVFQLHSFMKEEAIIVPKYDLEDSFTPSAGTQFEA